MVQTQTDGVNSQNQHQHQNQDRVAYILAYLGKVSDSRPMVLRSVFAKNIGTIVKSLFIKRVVNLLCRTDSSQHSQSRPRWSLKCKFPECCGSPSTRHIPRSTEQISRKSSCRSKTTLPSAPSSHARSHDPYRLNSPIQFLPPVTAKS
jgi:hypothetical protein